MQDVREMARAAGQSFPGFTPPKGETQEQVRKDDPVFVALLFHCVFMLFLSYSLSFTTQGLFLFLAANC